ncbi:putative lipid transport family protein [Blattamonas nauphoetae]|uniref:Lipid transport family protein n=1 Tax=Blattamonas nauphoetae TaxID=2049346 RepID=A0ABQ9Y2Y8_9EUKA|nr:putative lipid transport family protein [Blattamonas nauphoetae]
MIVFLISAIVLTEDLKYNPGYVYIYDFVSTGKINAENEVNSGVATRSRRPVVEKKYEGFDFSAQCYFKCLQTDSTGFRFEMTAKNPVMYNNENGARSKVDETQGVKEPDDLSLAEVFQRPLVFTLTKTGSILNVVKHKDDEDEMIELKMACANGLKTHVTGVKTSNADMIAIDESGRHFTHLDQEETIDGTIVFESYSDEDMLNFRDSMADEHDIHFDTVATTVIRGGAVRASTRSSSYRLVEPATRSTIASSDDEDMSMDSEAESKFTYVRDTKANDAADFISLSMEEITQTFHANFEVVEWMTEDFYADRIPRQAYQDLWTFERESNQASSRSGTSGRSSSATGRGTSTGSTRRPSTNSTGGSGRTNSTGGGGSTGGGSAVTCPGSMSVCKGYQFSTNVGNKNFGFYISGKAIVGTSGKCGEQSGRDWVIGVYGNADIYVLKKKISALDLVAEYGYQYNTPFKNAIDCKVFGKSVFSKKFPDAPCFQKVIDIANVKKDYGFKFTIVVIILPVTFQVGVSLEFRAKAPYEVCLQNISAQISFEPTGAVSAFAEARASIILVRAGIRLQAGVSDTLKPTAFVDGGKCKIGVYADNVVTALNADFYGYVQFRKLKWFKLKWGKERKVSFWKWSTSPKTSRLFTFQWGF